jgi:hypothetical protein
MTVQNFHDLLTQRPFKPFRIVMSSGERYEVRHPENAFLTRSTLYVSRDFDEDGIPADATMCSLLHITNVEPIPRNGQPKRRKRQKK